MKKIIYFVLIISIFFPNNNIFGQSYSGIQVNLNVNGCNNNGTCEAIIGEDQNSCPADCSVVIPPSTPTLSFFAGGRLIEKNFFINLSTISYTDKTLISWDSDIYSSYTIKWGINQNSNYLENQKKSIFFTKDHKELITNLKDGTIYFFQIKAQDSSGSSDFYSGIFKTQDIPEKNPPQNPTNFKGEIVDSTIKLTWQNTTDKDFSYNRILKSTDGYINSPFYGKLIYEGVNNSYQDNDVLPNKTYFYTIFSRDLDGNFSSGAITKVNFIKNLIDKNDNLETKDDKNKDVFFVIQKDKINIFGDSVRLAINKNLPIEISTKWTNKDLKQQNLLVKVFEKDELLGEYVMSKNDFGFKAEIPAFKKDGNFTIAIYSSNENKLQEIKKGDFFSKYNNFSINKNPEEIKTFLVKDNRFPIFLVIILFLFFRHFFLLRKMI